MDNQRPAWFIPFGICCLALILFCIAGTIILALIPVYLSTRNINRDTAQSTELLPVAYASDVIDGRSLTLSNTNSVGSQIANASGLSSDNLVLESGGFASANAASKKRAILSGTVTCERATGLSGDIFIARFRIKYPFLCFTTRCRRSYRARIQNALRHNYQAITVIMVFTNGETRTVRLVFCAFIDSDPTTCTAETRNNIYFLSQTQSLYQFTPSTGNYIELGRLDCSTTSNVTSIALQRNGVIWALLMNGGLYTYNLRSKNCTETKFVQNQTSITSFAMAFVKNTGSDTETLYISKYNGGGGVLGTIDTTTLTVSIVGNYSDGSFADLGGTNDGRLFGFFSDDRFIIKEIDKTNAQILSQYPLNGTYNSAIPGYGFAPHQSNFFVYIANARGTDITLFNPSTNSSTAQLSVPDIIYSAASSTCLGT